MPAWPQIPQSDQGERMMQAEQYLRSNPIKIMEKTDTHMDILTFSEDTYNNTTISRGDYDRKWHRLVFGKKITTDQDLIDKWGTDRIATIRRLLPLGSVVIIPKDPRSTNKKHCVITPGHIEERSNQPYPEVVGCSCLDYLFCGPSLDTIVQDPFTGRQYPRYGDGDAVGGCKHILAYRMARGDDTKFTILAT